MFKKIVAVVLVIALTAAASIAGTMAYLQAEDSDVNVMTLGNVKIAQHEFERVTDENGNYTTTDVDGIKSYELKEFTQGKPLYPFVGDVNNGYDPIPVRLAQLGHNSRGGMDVLPAKNVQDKFVVVENTGKSDAYVRTIVAFEAGSVAEADWYKLVKYSSHFTWKETQDWFVTEINGNNYYLAEFVYNGYENIQHPNGVLKPGDYTYNSLAQVYMFDTATNEDVVALDGNNNGTFDILVLSQAVQTAGFDNAKAALDEAFGVFSEANAANVAAWFGGMGNPELYSWEGVNYLTIGETVEVSSAGGDTVYRGILSEGKTTASNIKIGEGITRLNNRSLCKDMNLKEVTLPDSLTYIDEGVFQQSGFVEIEVPENVTYIGETAFGACPDLETIVIKAKNVTFANYVARDSGALKEVYIYSDTVTFETGSMYFTNKQTGDASGITFYVSNQVVADALFNASSASRSYGMLIKSIDGTTEYYNTLK